MSKTANECLLEAAKDLAELRKGSRNWKQLLTHFRNTMKEGELSLQKVGTSEAELADLRKKGCQTRAIWLLNILIEYKKEPKLSEFVQKACSQIPELIEEELSPEGLDFDVIGKTKEEVTLLAHS